MIVLAIIFLFLTALFVLPCGIYVATIGGDIHARLIIFGFRTPIRLKKSAKQIEQKLGTEEDTAPEDWPEIIRTGIDVTLHVIEEIGKGLFQRIVKTRKRFTRVFRFKVHSVFLKIASPDPFVTGIAYGAAFAVSPQLQSRFPFEFVGDFESRTPRVDVKASVTLIPVHLIFEFIRMLFVLRIFSIFKILNLKKLHS